MPRRARNRTILRIGATISRGGIVIASSVIAIKRYCRAVIDLEILRIYIPASGLNESSGRLAAATRLRRTYNGHFVESRARWYGVEGHFKYLSRGRFSLRTISEAKSSRCRRVRRTHAGSRGEKPHVGRRRCYQGAIRRSRARITAPIC